MYIYHICLFCTREMNVANGKLDIFKRARKWDKWDKFGRLSAMFADAVGGRPRLNCKCGQAGGKYAKWDENTHVQIGTREEWLIWKRGTGLLAGGGGGWRWSWRWSQLSDLGGLRAFSTGVTCAAPCQLALSVSRWRLSREFYQRLVFSFFPTKNILKWKTRSDVGVNKLYWIDGTGSLSDGMGLPCISKLYLLRMGRGGGVGLLTKRMEGLWKGCVKWRGLE